MSDRPKLNEIQDHWFFSPYALVVLHDLGGNEHREVAKRSVLDYFDIPDKLLKKRTREGKSLVLETRVHWSIVHLTILGFIVSSAPKRGHVSLASRGKQAIPDIKRALDEGDEAWIDDFIESLKSEYESIQKKNKPDASEQEMSEPSEEEQEVLAEISKTKDIFKKELGYIKKMDPFAFERLCGELFKRTNHKDVKNTRRTKDGGFDGVGYLETGLARLKVIFECKRYKNSAIPKREIQAFRSAISEQNADKGVFITTSDYTQDSRNFEREYPEVTLINGEQLLNLLKEHRIATRLIIDPDEIENF